MTQSPEPAMQQLRDSTRDEHDRAEHHAFQQSLVRGELPRTGYVAWLGQMYLLHRSLEGALQKARPESAAIATVVRDYQYQVPYLLADLEYFEIDPATISPLPATRRFLALVEEHQDQPLFLLGLHYVLEGSNNGGRFIARHAAKAYDLESGAGLDYLDPYGDRQREYWSTFKDDMGSMDFSAQQTATLVAAAKQMYQSIAELSDDLVAVG